MKFLYPEFLWALGVLAIPILLHLFNFRRFKKVIFPNLRFLQEVQVQNKSKQQLRKWLVLVARCLMLIFLVLAFARPYFPGPQAEQTFAGNLVSIYLDNSFSMNAQSDQGELLEQAKERARDLAKAYAANDRFQLLTNDFEGRHQRFESKERFLQWVDEVQLSPKSRKMSDVFARQKDGLESETSDFRKVAVQISDFQKSQANASELPGDSTINLYLLPLTANSRDNISIDSAWISTPYVRAGEALNMRVKLSNRGETDISDLNLVLKIASEQKGLQNLNLEAGKEAEVEVNFTLDAPGWYSGQLEIQDYPVVFDDQLFFSLKVQEQVKVLVINGGASSKYIKGVFATDAYFSVEEVDARGLDYARFAQADLIVANGIEEWTSGLQTELNKYLERGGDIYFIPSSLKADAANNFLTEVGAGAFGPLQTQSLKVKSLQAEHPLFQDIQESASQNTAMPVIKKSYPLGAASASASDLILLENEQALLRHTAYKKGNLYLLGTGLEAEWGDFALHYLFPSTLLRLGIFSKEVPALYYVLGESAYVPVDAERSSDKVLFELEGNGLKSVPEMLVRDKKMFIGVQELLSQSGLYQLKEKDNGRLLAELAFNYARTESDMEYSSLEELSAIAAPGMHIAVFDASLASVSERLIQQDGSKQLWKQALLLALLFLTIEILLLRFLK
ncbi:MAG: hypothetical protein EP332_11845 [Bacteroidetes bacterium]|nr:MAG: hypothetical protein EP332_11845 [Bacteroidota bacterium]